MDAWEGKQRYGWGGIHVYSGSVFSEYTSFENIGYNYRYMSGAVDGALKGNAGAAMTFNHCLFNSHYGNGYTSVRALIEGDKASINVNNSVFSNTTAGEFSSLPIILTCH